MNLTAMKALTLVAVSLAGVGSGQETTSAVDAVHRVRAASRALATSCSSGDWECMGEAMYERAEAVEDLTVAITAPLQSMDDLLSRVETAKTDVSNVALIWSAIKTAVTVAGNLPGVGPAFKGIGPIVKAVDTALGELDDGFKTIHNNLINPWLTSVESILLSVTSLEDALERVGGTVTTFGDLIASNDVCLTESMSTLVPSLAPIFPGFKSAVPDLYAALITLYNALEALSTAAASNAWRQVENTLEDLMDGIKVITGAADLLQPLSDLLDEKITLPWIGRFYFKHNDGPPSRCPDSHPEKGTFACYESCPSDYKAAKDDFACWQKCPSGYTEVGFACENKMYLPTVKWENVKYCCHSWKRPAGKIKRWCDSGWEHVLTTCVKDCKDDYKRSNIAGVRTCYKSCPNGMSITPDKGYCNRKTKNRGSTGFRCASDYKNILGLCYKKCKSDEEDLGYSCFKEGSISFTIREVMDEVDKAMGTLEDLPIVSDIMDAIEDAVEIILKPVTDILSALGLPTAEDLPTINVNFASVDVLPVSGLPAAMSAALDIPEFLDPAMLAQIPEEIEAQVDKLAQKVGLPEGWTGCTDADCVADQLGLDSVELTALTDELDAVQTPLNTAALNFVKSIKGCNAEQTVSLPVTESLVAKLGLDEDEEMPCSIDLTLCTELDADFSALQTELDAIDLGALSTAVRTAAGMADDEVRRALRSDGRRDLVFDDGARIMLLKVPLSILLPHIKAGFGGVNVKWVSEIEKAKIVGGYVEVDPRFSLYMHLVVDPDGGDRLHFSVGGGIHFGGVFSRNNVHHVVRDTLDALRDQLKVIEASVCVKRFVESTDAFGNAQIDYEFNTALAGSTCSSFNTAARKILNPDLWDWHPTNSLPTYWLDKYPADDPYWKTTEGLKLATKMVTYLHKLGTSLFKANTYQVNGWSDGALFEYMDKFWNDYVSKRKIFIPIPTPNKPREDLELLVGAKVVHNSYDFGLKAKYDVNSDQLANLSVLLANFKTAMPKSWPVAFKPGIAQVGRAPKVAAIFEARIKVFETNA